MTKEILENRVTGEAMTILQSTAEAFRFRFSLGPRCSIPGTHFHPNKEQRVSVISGEMHLRVNGVHHIVGAGESMTVPAGAHHFQWNPSDSEMIAIEEIRPAGRIHDMFATVFGLANDGRTNSRGYPSPLLAATLVSEFKDSILPASLGLRLLFGALGPLAKILGLRPFSREVPACWR
jgi:quercetin dioxygenase-like cupin family protein